MPNYDHLKGHDPAREAEADAEALEVLDVDPDLEPAAAVKPEVSGK